MKKKSQGGIEFLIISIAVLFFFTLFFLAIQASTSEKTREKEASIIKNLALSIQDEISLATQASNGYIREFEVPQQISGKNYEIKIINQNIYIKTERNTVSYKVDDIICSSEECTLKGTNTIKKQDNKVYLN